MISRHLEASLNQALRSAERSRHQYATVEHLLLALLDNPEVRDIILAMNVNPGDIAQALEDYLKRHVPVFDTHQGAIEVTPTLGFQRVIQRAVNQVQSAGRDLVTGGYVLAAIFNEKDSHAVYFLESHNITRLDVQSLLSHGSIQRELDPDAPDSAPPGAPEADPGAPQRGHDPLAQFTVNLTQRGREGRIDPLIGREREIARMLQILCRRRKNNPLLVGDAGVGKTHLAEGLALRMTGDKAPEPLAGAEIFALDLGALLAGTKFRGDFEARLKGVVSALRQRPNAILFIDEIHSVIGAGATSGSNMDASALLKPLLATGELRCIGSTTYDEYRGIFEKDHALSRRFQKVEVPEPSLAETIEILKGLRQRYEEHHDVRYSHAAIRSAAELSARHIPDRRNPDAAIDVLDEAGAAVRLQPPSRRKRSIGVREIETTVSLIARIPPRSVSHDDRAALKSLDRQIKLSLFGQDRAVDQVCDAIRLSRAGLANENKPIGSFLFAGPTGVGKTELSLLLARQLGITLVRFDMSEYMERHTVSRLIGAPPGYVGFDQGGLLTDAIHKTPHAVLLLDEVEKAHPDVFNLLLQIMDHGKLTDNNGRSTDFRNVILIMTSNAGAHELQRPSVGFVSQDHVGDDRKAIERLFPPEFRNRLDAIVSFSALEPDHILRVVDKFLLLLEADLARKNVDLVVDDAVRAWLGRHGYDRHNGARPMERLIREHLRKPLAAEILFGPLSSGGVARITVVEDGLRLTAESGASAAVEAT
ncbi:MAG: ATP-dependent Clp protease ATP-binding subunit ClpA [Magnetococcus sp. WYHC-3]